MTETKPTPATDADITAAEARALLDQLVEALSEFIPKKSRDKAAGDATIRQKYLKLAGWMRGRAAMPANFPGVLNFIGRHSQELATVSEPANGAVGVHVHWPQCGCFVAISPLCNMGIDHRADAQYQRETGTPRPPGGPGKPDASPLPATHATPGPQPALAEARP